MGKLRTEKGIGKRKRSSRWAKFSGECVWCGENFNYFSPMAEDGSPKRLLRYCKRACIAESRWEGRRKLPMARSLAELYVIKGLSIPQIARQFGCANTSVRHALNLNNIPIREQTSVRSCKTCGQPAEKRFHSRRSKDGCRILYGAYCRFHRLEYYQSKYREYSRRDDPLIGTRGPGGRKAIPTKCPKCLTEHPTARAAVNCCGQDWSKVVAMRKQNANPISAPSATRKS